jgi:dihydroxyacetone kinase-like protein
VTLASAQVIAEEMVGAILGDLAPKRGAEAILFVNGFGATPLIELYLLYREAARIVQASGVKPIRSLVGSYVTSLDMAGASITVSLLEGEATKLWDAPVHTAALRWGI